MNDYFRMLKFLRPHLALLIVAIIVMGFSSIFDGLSIASIVPMADRVLTNKPIIFNRSLPENLTQFIELLNSIPPLELLKLMALILVVLFFLKGLFQFLQSYLMEHVSKRVHRDIRVALFNKYQSLSLDYFSQKKLGKLISRITYDVSVINNAITQALTDIFYQSFRGILFLIVPLLINWKLALMAFVLFPVIIFPVVKMGKTIKKISGWIQEKMAELNSIIYEALPAMRIVKAFGMEKHEKENFARHAQGFYKMSMKYAKRVKIISPMTEFVGSIGALIILLIGGRMVINGEMSFGVFGLFLGSLLSCLHPFKRLSNVYGIIQGALAASERIYEVLDAPITIKEKSIAGTLPPFKNNIRFKNVHFCYVQNEGEILQDIDLEVGKGEMVALVGPTGVGKTTLVNLLPRFYDPTGGSIEIDSVDIRDVTVRSLRGQIAVVTQDPILFNDTVRNNISYGRLGASTAEIKTAARIANADQFIVNLSQDYDTVIGDRGFRLSGGEKQRIAIARAVLKNAPILILDEATSQLDTQSERLVQEALERLMQGKTVFVIAHRLSTVARADRIVVLDKGRITQIGKHEDLVKKRGLYKTLYDMQFRK